MTDAHGDPRRRRPPRQGQSQPDLMLQTGGRNSLRGWVVILAAVVVLCLVLYGLNAQRPEQAASGNAPAVTAAPAPAAGTPAPPPQTTTGRAAPPAASGASGQPKPGDQGEGESPRQNTR